ncbi:efflux RND transporter periplasmic adaptor subunit [Chloroflexota bacterium]
MRKITIVSVLLLCLILTGVTACAEMGAEKETANEPVRVERGDLTVDVSGSGNIEVYKEMKLTFGIGGRVKKIYVEEGEEVSEGDVIAELETGALELALAQAELAYVQAQALVVQAESTITQAQLALKSAQYALDKAEDVYEWPELEVAYANVEKATLAIDSVQSKIDTTLASNPGADISALSALLGAAYANLVQEEIILNAMLSGADKEEVAIQKLQVQIAEEALEIAEQSLEIAQQSPKVSEKSLAQVQKQLSDAVITAPFDGIVASISVDEKDTVSSMNQVAYLIDPSMMELKVDVDEIDIADVSLGQEAIIEVDALSDLELEGEVSFINHLSKEEGGVIIYEVKVRFDVADDSGLKGGMSASTNIIIDERNDVLLVPSRAVKRNSDGDTIVEIAGDGGENEERIVTVGISDGFQTEIINGLEEGDRIMSRQ